MKKLSCSSIRNRVSGVTLGNHVSNKSSKRSLEQSKETDSVKTLRFQISKTEQVFEQKLKNIKPIIFAEAANYVREQAKRILNTLSSHHKDLL